MNSKQLLKNSYKRLLALSLALTLTVSLAGCSVRPGSPSDSQDTTLTTQDEQQRFDGFLDEVFLSEMTENTLNMHFSLAHPENFGIDDYEVTLGGFSAEEDRESYDLVREYLEKLKNFQYELLAEDQQLTYDIFYTYLEDLLKMEDYRLYHNYLSTINGMHTYIPTLLAEYTFYRERDVKDYLEILELLPSYFESLGDFAKEQSEAGFFPPDYIVDEVIEQCEEFMENQGDHYLIDSFTERLDETDFLTEDAKASYRESNENLLQTCVFPAFTSLLKTLEELKGTATNDRGLEAYENGQEFYELLVRDSTGSSKSVEEIEELLLNLYDSCIDRIMEIASEDETAFDRMEECPVDLSDPYQVLNDLKAGIAADFPDNGDMSFEVNYVPASMEGSSSPAYYLLPPIDNRESNVIYINQKYLSNDIEDFVTLAHEGFPGHLFQTTYFYGTNPNKIRKIFSFSGYTEGWGTYAEIYAYRLAGLDDTVVELNELNKVYTLLLYCLADIGINYEGWTREDTLSFFSALGIGEEGANEVFETMVSEPALYLAYFLGYLEFSNLRETAESTLGEDFDLKEFHTFLMDIGPAQFEIVENRMQRWMEGQQ